MKFAISQSLIDFLSRFDDKHIIDLRVAYEDVGSQIHQLNSLANTAEAQGIQLEKVKKLLACGSHLEQASRIGTQCRDELIEQQYRAAAARLEATELKRKFDKYEALMTALKEIAAGLKPVYKNNDIPTSNEYNCGLAFGLASNYYGELREEADRALASVRGSICCSTNKIYEAIAQMKAGIAKNADILSWIELENYPWAQKLAYKQVHGYESVTDDLKKILFEYQSLLHDFERHQPAIDQRSKNLIGAAMENDSRRIEHCRQELELTGFICARGIQEFQLLLPEVKNQLKVAADQLVARITASDTDYFDAAQINWLADFSTIVFANAWIKENPVSNILDEMPGGNVSVFEIPTIVRETLAVCTRGNEWKTHNYSASAKTHRG